MDRKSVIQRILGNSQQSRQYVRNTFLKREINPIHSGVTKRVHVLHLGKSNLKGSKPLMIDINELDYLQRISQHKSFTLSMNRKLQQGTKSQRRTSYYNQRLKQQKSSQVPDIPKISTKKLDNNKSRIIQLEDKKVEENDQQRQQYQTRQIQLSQELLIQLSEADLIEENSPTKRFVLSQKSSDILIADSEKTQEKTRSYIIKNFPKNNQSKTSKNNQIKILKNFQELQQQAKKMKVLARKSLHKQYAKPFIQPPKITSISYIIYQCSSEHTNSPKLHYAFQSKSMLEVASLTKIMTCILTIDLCQKFGITLNEQKIQITKYQSDIPGTSANIESGDIYTIQQLLYGMMLPSGNDASFAIAIYIGKKLLISDNTKSKIQKSKQTLNSTNYQANQPTKRTCYYRFITEMNKKAAELGMTKTKYANSHGLANQFNKSCCYDLALLCNYALKNKIFSQIVRCKNYNCKIIAFKDESYEQQQKVKKKQQKNGIDQDLEYHNKRLLDLQQADLEVEQKYQQQSIENQQRQSLLSQSKIIKGAAKYTQKQIFWENTHKLVNQKESQYIGIKTGVTKSAGPCLASCLLSPQGRKFIIIILSCKSMKWRFIETEILKKWVYRKQGIFIKKRKQSNLIEQHSLQEQSIEYEQPSFHSFQNIPI